MNYVYDEKKGIAYARLYAYYFSLSEDKRLFFYDRNGNDCTNFCSQCVWAAYGGWIPGIDNDTVNENKERIKKQIRMISSVWYGSLFFSGSNKWCRVVEFHDYSLAAKNSGPSAFKVYEGDWQSFSPSSVREGDIIQLIVKTYSPYRYGHCLYVTQNGESNKDIKICCHSYDRLDAPLSEFSDFPDTYTRLRIMRYKSAGFPK
ncbi:MAG TPA: hypothetical protein GXZ22_06710 [Clostridiaceae bacterium]|jgi:hypothetical protein|nr:hypothetical protein [Clostridiaceae bacterium]